MKAKLALIMFAISTHAFAGGGGGGTPPAVADEQISISSLCFAALLRDVSNDPEGTFTVNGKQAKPTTIDLQGKVIRFETDDKKIIDVNTEQ